MHAQLGIVLTSCPGEMCARLSVGFQC